MARVIPFAFWVCLLLSSCTGYRQTDIVSTIQQIHDSIATFKLPANQFNTVQVTIANTEDSTQSFYLTPAGYDFRYARTIATSVVGSTMKSEEKAIALWRFVKKWTNHSRPFTPDHSPHDPLYLINSFQSGLCDDRNTALAHLFREIDLPAHVVELGGHMVAEVYYNNSWHMFDADLGVCFKDSYGNIVSAEQISSSAERESLYAEGNSSVWQALANGYMGTIYRTKDDNRVNEWQMKTLGGLSENIIKLNNKGDELTFRITRLNAWDRITRIGTQHNFNKFSVQGTLKKTITVPGNSTWLGSEYSAYAVTKIDISGVRIGNKGSVKVYYSANGKDWFFKGILKQGTHVSFTPASEENEPCAFSYLLKLDAEGTTADSMPSLIQVRNTFLFTDLLFTNPEKTFKIVSADSTALKGLSVKMEYTK